MRVALAGTCGPNGCLGLTVADVVNSFQPPGVDSVPGSEVLSGTRASSFVIRNTTNQTATNASISVQSGYPASRFDGVSSLPVSTSTATLGVSQELQLDLHSNIPIAFRSRFDSSRTMDPQAIPSGGGVQTVHVAFTRTDSSACITDTPGTEGCTWSGHLDTGLPGASIVGVSDPTNLDNSEGFNKTVQSTSVSWGLNDPILGKRYEVAVQISLPDRGRAYRYKPVISLALGAAGPHGCQQDQCPSPTTHVSLADPALDGATPGAGQAAFSVDQQVTWDEGGPPLQSGVIYTGLVAAEGYWLVAADGGIFPFGGGGGFGSTGNVRLNQPIVGMAPAPDGRGYWLTASDGGIFPFGNAAGLGSTGNIKLNKPIVGMAATPDGGGYWLAASDGGIFPFGDAAGLGSTGNITLNKPIVGMAATPDGGGYWLVASDGGIFPFGDATGLGSTGNVRLNRPIVGMAATPDGGGYWLVASDGGIFPFGDAGGFGSTGNMTLNQPIVKMASTPTGRGYWLVASDGGIFPFGDATGFGSLGGMKLNQPIVGIASA